MLRRLLFRPLSDRAPKPQDGSPGGTGPAPWVGVAAATSALFTVSAGELASIVVLHEPSRAVEAGSPFSLALGLYDRCEPFDSH